MGETINTLNLDHGRVARIVHDTQCDSPYEGDEGVRIVWLHRRYNDPAEGACGTTPDEVAEWCDANAAGWFTVPLWMMDHGNIALGVGATNPFSCPWDSGRIGIVALRRSAWSVTRQLCDKTETERFLEIASGVADTYAMWSNGECFGFVIEEDGEEVESCWGYIGQDVAEEAAREAAEGLGPTRRQMRDLADAMASALV